MQAGWETVVQRAQERADIVKAEQEATIGAAFAGTAVFYTLPLTPGDGLAGLLLSCIVGGGFLGFVAGFRDDKLGDATRKVGGAVSGSVRTVAAKIDETGVTEKIKANMPGNGGEGLSMADIKKFGVSGTLAYILTELAFWIVAFPVASTTFYNTAGHWPDWSDGGDRTAVLAFIFAGANVARLAVPLRFGVAFALAPWVDENIVQKFGMGGGDAGPDGKQ